MATLGELTGFALNPKKQEELEVRNELLRHKCARCVVEKRLEKDKREGFRLLSEHQRSLYNEIKRLPHKCGAQEFVLFKYEMCECKHVGDFHVEKGPNMYGKCNMKNCGCIKYNPLNV